MVLWYLNFRANLRSFAQRQVHKGTPRCGKPQRGVVQEILILLLPRFDCQLIKPDPTCEKHPGISSCQQRCRAPFQSSSAGDIIDLRRTGVAGVCTGQYFRACGQCQARKERTQRERERGEGIVLCA